MFLGHFAVAFAAKKAVPAVSLGALFLAGQFADLLWPVLVLLGVEEVRILPGATAMTPLDFVSYPYSHSLNALAGCGNRDGRRRVADEALVCTRRCFGSAPPAAEVVIARAGAEPVGFALWFHNHSTFLGRRGLYLEDLFVAARVARTRGRPRAARVYLAQVAVERNCGRMEWSVSELERAGDSVLPGLGAKTDGRMEPSYGLTGDAIARLAAS